MSADAHNAFLRDIQSWVCSRWPTRQLSAVDIYYILKWASSGIPSQEFIQYFNHFIEEHPHYFDDGLRLSRLQCEATRLISDNNTQKPHKTGSSIPIPVNADDPYIKIINNLIICGKRTKNLPLRDILRKAYHNINLAHKAALESHPNCRLTPEIFYQYKGLCFHDNEIMLSELFDNMQNLLTAHEIDNLKSLNQSQQLHLFKLGPQAAQKYVERIYKQHVFEYFEINILLENI